MNFDHIFNWKLLSGSHDFPGPDGGTCLNEAAIIAAGFKYRKVGTAKDCPSCFSRPIASYAISLNDKMPDALRQKLLMPFVTRLAGTADTPDIEQQRAEFILIGLVRVIVALQPRSGADDAMAPFRAVRTLAEAQKACEHLPHALSRGRDRDRACNLASAIELAITCDLTQTRDLATTRGIALGAARALALSIAIDLDLEIFEAVTRLLDGALKIGRKSMPLDTPLVERRMDKVRQPANA